ncbi:MAG: glycosyltransferase family 39 protein, partial [Nanoarchaeota archaeon]
MEENKGKNIEKRSNFSDKIASLIVYISYSKNKTLVYVLSLTVIGFILRLISALNMNVLADDMLYASQSAGIISSNILSTHSNPPLFFYLTDLVYKLFGYTTLASRFWPLIFGTLLIPLSYLITRKFFNEKVSILAALFVTFSTFLIKLTYTEQSLVVLFFSILGIYLGLDYIDKEKPATFYLSAVMFGLALLTKYSAPFFILSFLIFAPVYA